MNIISTHKEEDSNICIGSLVTWCKPNWGEIFSIALPSLVVMSVLHQLLYFTLKSPRNTTEKGLFCTADSTFTSRLFLKHSNWPCDWLGDLYNAMMLRSLSPAISSNLAHSSKWLKSMILKGKWLLQYYEHLHVFFMTDQNALNPGTSRLLPAGKIFQSRYVSDKQIISNLWIELYALGKNSLAKLCPAMLVRFQG